MFCSSNRASRVKIGVFSIGGHNQLIMFGKRACGKMQKDRPHKKPRAEKSPSPVEEVIRKEQEEELKKSEEIEVEGQLYNIESIC